MKTRPLFAFIILLGLIGFSACRETMDLPQGEVSLLIDTTEGTVGDWFHVTLAAPGLEDTSILWPDIHGTMGDLVVLSANTLSGSRRTTIGGPAIEYTVSAYDTGAFSTGELDLIINGEPVTIGPDTIRIFSVLDAETDSTLAPLKGQEEIPVTFADIVRWVWPWLTAGIIIALLIVLYHVWRKHLKRQRGEDGTWEKPLPPPYDEAVAALTRLKYENPLQVGDTKTYVTRLTGIIKRLLERVHEAPIQEMTTYEVKRWTTQNNVCKANVTLLLQLLTEADTVKFAKGSITREHADSMYANVQQMVEAYKPSSEDDITSDEKTTKQINTDNDKDRQMTASVAQEPAVADYAGKREPKIAVTFSPPAAGGRAAQSFCNVSGMQLQAQKDESPESEQEDKE